MTKPPPRSHFKAIIIGGSVAGLTLAHTLSQAGIDYVLLEARDSISPQLGAGILIMPNGARILEQLGVYHNMEPILTKMKVQHRRRGDNGKIVFAADWPKTVQDRLGYPCGIMERKHFLQSLYDQLKDQSKVLLNKKVTSFRHSDEDVTVLCADGTEFVGSIVIGADGIHSKTRQEMHKYADKDGPPGLMDQDKLSVTAEYNCFFGISSKISSLLPGDGHISSDINHSSLLFVSKHGLPQWFFFSKMDKKYQGSSIPRFTRAEMEAQVEKYADFRCTEDITLKDLMDKTTALSYLALEEANHKWWFYKRVVCVGDSIHKMTPNLGQGGNQAIESAAVLTNCLLEMLTHTTSQTPTTPVIKEALKKYQDLRQARAELFVRLSRSASRDEALDTLRHTLRFLFLEPISGDRLADLQMTLYTTGPYLKYLPLPERLKNNEYWNEGLMIGREKEKEKENEKPRARL